jgi:hypothetical protein
MDFGRILAGFWQDFGRGVSAHVILGPSVFTTMYEYVVRHYDRTTPLRKLQLGLLINFGSFGDGDYNCLSGQ